LSKYKIIKKRQFAYSAMQVGRDETVRVVLYSFDEPTHQNRAKWFYAGF
jgi:type I restriction enzyme S subunit